MTIVRNIKPLPHSWHLMVFLISAFLHTHQNIMGILNDVIIILLKRVYLFSLMLPCLSHISHMHLPLLFISLITCQLPFFTFFLYMQNSLEFSQTTLNFISLVVYVILGSVHTLHTN